MELLRDFGKLVVNKFPLLKQIADTSTDTCEICGCFPGNLSDSCGADLLRLLLLQSSASAADLSAINAASFEDRAYLVNSAPIQF